MGEVFRIVPEIQDFEAFHRKSALTLCLIVSSADNLCKQFGLRSAMAECRA